LEKTLIKIMPMIINARPISAGKSRFLRSIFATPLEFSDINYIDPTPYLESLKEKAIDVYPRNFGFQNSYGGNLKDSFLDKVNLLINEKSVASKNQFKRNLKVPYNRKCDSVFRNFIYLL
jgi:hypothetical protein